MIRSMFARIARRYDLNNRLHSMGRDQAWRRAAAAMTGVAAGEEVLDVACGTGDLTAMLARRAPAPGRVVGADFCPEMLQIARRKFAHLSIEWLEADAHALPFAPASFDVVTVAFGLRNLARPREAIAHWCDLLRPGGRLVVLEFTPDTRGPVGRAIAWFTRYVMSRTASAIAADKGGAYDYLHNSVQSFLTARELADALADAGLSEVRTRRMTAGVVAICRGRKER